VDGASATAAVREEARAWFEENWSPELTLGDWWERLAESGWGFPSWPTGWFGRGLSGDAARAVHAERARAGAFGPPSGIATFLAAPSIFAYATEDQKQRFLPDIATGRAVWCQLFSEPGAGSDMASLQTRAVRDGDEWVVTGQKVWNSGAQFADRAILIARTDPDVPKHRGITFFLFDMRQPGVEVRPLREMTGDAAFNEVFLTEARVADSDRLGALDDGWRVAMTTLSHERDPNNSGLSSGGGSAIERPDLSLTVAEYRRRQAATQDAMSIALGGGIGEVFDRITRRAAVAADPARRDQLMGLHALRSVSKFSGLRARDAARAGQQPGPEVSTLKLLGAEIGRRTRDLGLQAMGPEGTLIGADAPEGGTFHKYALFTPASSIAGGSDEVNRNIIGERVLGLPKEPDQSKDLPFRDIRKGGS
jgi:alkylation response protein AidB-like acyl-CoA dehydrogenase